MTIKLANKQKEKVINIFIILFSIKQCRLNEFFCLKKQNKIKVSKNLVLINETKPGDIDWRRQ